MIKRKKIKILYTIPNFDTAGSGKVVYDLVKGLDTDIFNVEIACSSNRGVFFKEMENLGVPIHILETTTSYRPFYNLLTRIKTIRDFFKIHKYDIIHSWHWSSDWTEVLAARWAGAKWVYTKKSMGWGNKHWKIRSYMANFIITINDEMKNYFPTKKNQSLIPLGIDTDYYNSELFKKDKPEDSYFSIITVANLVPVKGIEVLIKSIKMLNDPKVKLTVVGDNKNEYGLYLASLCKNLNVERQIDFLGKKPDVRSYIAAADLYVIPTLNEGRKEGMPMALVEAMSMGIPVLGSDISGINFVLKDFPNLLFPSNNLELLTDKIKALKNLSLIERQKLGKQLRQTCLKKFRIEAFISKHEDLYNSLVSKI